MFDSLKYYFWWTVVKIYKINCRILYGIVPLSVLETKVCEKLDAFGIKVTVSSEGGEGFDPKTGHSCELVVHNREFFRRFARDKLLGVGESYMDGA
jgi:hypothetical protein